MDKPRGERRTSCPLVPYRMCGIDTKETYLEILYFRQFVFVEDVDENRNKRIEKYFEVSAVVDVGCGDTRNSYF